MIIAIDGPSGSGKSTLGRMLARELKLLYLDTGSMYRAVALAVLEAKVDPRDSEAVVKIATTIDIDLQGDPDSLKVLLDGRDPFAAAAGARAADFSIDRALAPVPGRDACRMYVTARGLAPAPSVDQLRSALILALSRDKERQGAEDHK